MCGKESSDENLRTSGVDPCCVSIKSQRLLRNAEAVRAKKESMGEGQNTSEKNPDEPLYFTRF